MVSRPSGKQYDTRTIVLAIWSIGCFRTFPSIQQCLVTTTWISGVSWPSTISLHFSCRRLSFLFANQPCLRACHTKFNTDIPTLFAYEPFIFSYVTKLLPDVTDLFADIAKLLANFTWLFPHFTFVFADVTELFSYISQLFSHQPSLFPNLSKLLVDIPKLFTNKSVVFSDKPVLLSYKSSISFLVPGILAVVTDLFAH